MSKQSCRVGPVLRHAVEAEVEEIFPLGRHPLRDGRRRLARRDVKERGHLAAVFAPRGFSRGHLEHRATDAPYVRLSPVSRLFDNLRRHPIRRSLDAPMALRRDHLRQSLARAEIRQLDHSAVIHQDIRALNVPVHDLVTMQILQSREDLAGVDPDHRLAEASESPQEGMHGTPGDVFHEYVQRAILRAFRADVSNHVRMLESSHQRHLGLDLAERLGALVQAVEGDVVGVVAGESARGARRQRDLLHRHETAGVEIEAAVHASESAASDELAALPSDAALGWAEIGVSFPGGRSRAMLRGRARRARQRARDPGTIRGGPRVRVHQYGAERGMIDGASFGRPSHRGAVCVVALVAQIFTRDGTCLESRGPRVTTRVRPGRARRRGVVRFARAVVDLRATGYAPHRAHAGRISTRDPARAWFDRAPREAAPPRQPATSGEPSRRPLARYEVDGCHPWF